MTKQLQRPKKLNNRGFSLLELIVVIAIMAVLIAVAIATSSVLDGTYVRDAEQGISDYISLTRSKSMSVAAKDWYMVITKEGSEYKAQIYKTVSEGKELTTTLVYEYKLGKTQSIYYAVTVDELDSAVAISDTNQLKMYFNSSTGRVKQLVLGDNDVDISSGIGYIKIVSGSYEATVKVFLNTGKCERE